MPIIEKQTDLFLELSTRAETPILAHCISTDIVMGAGIAKEFNKRYGHRAALQRQGKNVGEAAFLNVKDTRIYYLITKEKYNNVLLLQNVKKSLEYMKKCIMPTNKETVHLLMPRIGSGLDKLNWLDVKKVIEEVFYEPFFEITICYI